MFASPLRTVLTAAVLFRIATGWLLSTRPSDLNVGDPGQWIDAGDRILSGEWPYREWTGIYGPLLYVWGAFWYGLLGADWRAALQMLEIVSPIACLLLAAATARLTLPTPRWRAGFVAAVALLGLDAFYWSPGIRIWLPVAALAWAANPPAGRWSWLPFAACGLTPLLSPDVGAPCLIAAISLASSGDGVRSALRLGSLAAPVLVAAGLAPALTAAWIGSTLELASVASWIWGTPFPGDLFAFRRMTFLLPFIATAAAGLHLVWSFRRLAGTRRRELLPDLAVWILAAGCLRSLLGRTDTAHLLFVLPPFLLLGFRYAVRSSGFGPIALAIVVMPFLWFSAVEGPVRRMADGWRAIGDTREHLAGERIALPPAFARHLVTVVESAARRLRHGESVLSLPGPLYAHLLRRPQDQTVAVPELLVLAGTAGPRALPSASVVIVDPALALPWDPYFLESPGGPLTWSTPADEPITRDLREHLRRHYIVQAVVEGARIMSRRATPLAPHRERTVQSLLHSPGDPEVLAHGDQMTLPAHGAVCDEIRTWVRFAYPPGMAGLAKSYTRLIAVDRRGRSHEMVQPLPPARLALELRWPVPRVALDRIVLEAGNPGSFNPDPISASIGPVLLIRYADWAPVEAGSAE